MPASKRPASVRLKLRLYVAGEAPNSVAARENLRALTAGHDAVDVEVVDVFQAPDRAMEDAVFVTPALIRLSPKPTRRIIGNLSDTAGLRQFLGLAPL